MPREPRVLTKAEIKQVSKLAGVLNYSQLADFFEVSKRTFDAIRERQPEVGAAYKKARAKTIGDVALSLVSDALSGCVTSRIFYLKTQANWRETERIELQQDWQPFDGFEISRAPANRGH